MRPDAAEGIKKSSHEQPYKIVIDERLPDGQFRILVSRMKNGISDDRKHDWAVWEDEEEHKVDVDRLRELLPEIDIQAFTEGRVFEIKQGVSEDIYNQDREYVKERTVKLLAHEGKSKRERPKEKW